MGQGEFEVRDWAGEESFLVSTEGWGATDPVSWSSLTSPVTIDKCWSSQDLSILYEGRQAWPPWQSHPGKMKRAWCWVPREHCRGHHLRHDASCQCPVCKNIDTELGQ